VTSIDRFESYARAISQLSGKLPLETIRRVVDLLVETREAGRFIYVMGNGGSAANASHFVNDLGKGGMHGFPRRFKVMSLTDAVPIITAWANDTDYDRVFAEQLRNFVGPRDVVLAISGSGNSRNILNAVELGRAHGATIVGLTGFDGGKLKDFCDHCILVPSNDMQHVEDMHLVVLHMIYCAIRDTAS